MDPVKRAELRARLEELKAEMKEKSLPGARVTNGVPSDIRAFLAEVAKKQRAALREAYSNREPLILRLNSRQDPCASPPDPVKSAELRAQFKEMKAKLKEQSLPGAKVTNGVPSKIQPFLAEAVRKKRAALREAYSNREPPILRLNSRRDPCASPPAFSEDGEGKEA
ncbi:hypothetical protein CFC21_069910 [Triticum aestivum]|uniref:Uncharacterized protein n=2 Tax=Triticum aestivum TaxID=4565 RepID=A0A9R1HCD9_WHEAT|nr:uncharacterized protein LOC123110336 isoform X2 [Triticum aestivum]KAF7063387.1 hypothetical protein CFC21_069910 [Triticum aestivum]